MWVRPCFAETPAWQDGVAVFRHGGDYNLGAILKTHYPAADENPPLGKRRFVHIQVAHAPEARLRRLEQRRPFRGMKGISLLEVLRFEELSRIPVYRTLRLHVGLPNMVCAVPSGNPRQSKRMVKRLSLSLSNSNFGPQVSGRPSAESSLMAYVQPALKRTAVPLGPAGVPLPSVPPGRGVLGMIVCPGSWRVSLKNGTQPSTIFRTGTATTRALWAGVPWKYPAITAIQRTPLFPVQRKVLCLTGIRKEPPARHHGIVETPAGQQLGESLRAGEPFVHSLSGRQFVDAQHQAGRFALMLVEPFVGGDAQYHSVGFVDPRHIIFGRRRRRGLRRGTAAAQRNDAQ